MSQRTERTETGSRSPAPARRGGRERFPFIDQFRGLVGVMMALGHSSYYFNAVWLSLDPVDPFFDSVGQFLLRYMGYLCAPGFLMMNGAMVYYSYKRRIASGATHGQARRALIQRGLFLVLVQMIWVNSTWSGFAQFRPGHFGIIACIGLSMCLVTLMVPWRWQPRLAVAVGVLLIHPFLLKIPYDSGNPLEAVPMQMFVDAGWFNKYPLLPWFALGTLGSIMAVGWLEKWTTNAQRARNSLLIALPCFLVAVAVRMGRGYGNIFPFDHFGTFSFFLDQKYPPSLHHQIYFFAAVLFFMAIIQLIGMRFPTAPRPLSVYGRVPLFFYAIHIPVIAIVSKRVGLLYREGGIATTLIAWIVLLIVMYPVCKWFANVKRRSTNIIIKMI